MKFFVVGIFCLLCTVVWAEGDVTPANEEDVEPEVVSIKIFTYEDDTYGIGLYEKVNWHQAELLCASQSSTLVSLTSEILYNEILEWIRSMANDDLPTIAEDPIWTSGNNLGDGSLYYWQGTGGPVYYNNFRNKSYSHSACIGFNAVTGYWTEHECRESHYFMCQKYSKQIC
ncbi:snaclec GPIB-binding protein subunit beta-like [Drosophila nasuta]|uniref:snaclec GPIB-binding protein subunit beta-like n=1 Tax=Drosophila nasuta TaxID=42062 RepID=UPI00295F34B4|nr:snaclec GPIB-binding protein subunit beta-like [Drosophila nasuta]